MVSYDLTFESAVDCHTPDVRLSLFASALRLLLIITVPLRVKG